jgi:hypothetical protein
MINEVAKAGLFKAKWIGADSFFGRNKEFLDNLPEGTKYFADVLFNIKIFKSREENTDCGSKPEAMRILDFVAEKDIPWNIVILGEGAKGPIIAYEKVFRVFEDRNGMPGEEVWLYVRMYEDSKIKFALCNAPGDTPIEELRRVATMRWPIEQCFEECKDNLGLDHYEGRSWLFWHRHMLFVFIAYLFLLEMRLRFKKNTNFNIGASPRASNSCF